MNIGFINPPSEFLIDQRVFLPLGILRVATSLNIKYDVKFLDLSNQNKYYELIDIFIKNDSLDTICITSTTPQIYMVYKFCKYIKNKYNNIKIILGGPHITLVYGSMQESTNDIKKQSQDHIKNGSVL